MDAINFWQQQVDKWNEEQFCDRSWVFGAPLSYEGANNQQTPPEMADAVHVIVTSYREGINLSRSRRTGLINSRTASYSMEVHFLQRDDLSRNVYNEVLGYPVEESRWHRILEPLRKCITPEGVLKFCEILGYPVNLTGWDMTPKISWLDNNYTGWSIRITFSTIDEE